MTVEYFPDDLATMCSFLAEQVRSGSLTKDDFFTFIDNKLAAADDADRVLLMERRAEFE